jgi:phosphoribosyl 1,2-cyclic phosphodiesterase
VGHLSNQSSAEFIALLAELGELEGVMLAHLSEKNNRPELALSTVKDRQTRDIPIHLAGQDEPSVTIKLEKK